METQQIEYKKSFGKEVIISLASFANTDGGRVIVGMGDKGEVCGVEIGPETLQQYQNEIKVATYPQLFPKIWIESQGDKQTIIFEISEFPVKPVSYKNRYYKRLHNSNHLLTLEEIVDLQQQSLSVSYDAYPADTSLAELDQKLIKDFFAQVNDRGRMVLRDDLLTNLAKLGLIRDGKVTIAANLLFGKADFTIRVGRFKGADTIIDDNIVRGPLFSAIDEAMTFIKKHINLSYHFDGSIQRKERWQFPLEALRELLLNCIVHRDYKNFSDIIIKIFDDQIIFTNPGRLYGNLQIEDIQRDDYTSSIRNKLLAEAFYLTGDIERYGTGFVRIRRYLQDYSELSVQVEEMGDFFKVDLATIEQVTEQVTQQVTPQVTQQVSRLLHYLVGAMSRSELMRVLDLKDRVSFSKNYLEPAMLSGMIEMTQPDSPKSPTQKYRLTFMGEEYLVSQG